MTLRLRLTLALVALVAVGLAVFGSVTYTFYSRAQYQRLDEQLRGVTVPVGVALNRSAGLDPAPTGPFPAPGGTAPVNQGFPLEVWGELVAGDGTVLATQVPGTDISPPMLPATLPRNGQVITVPSEDGSTEWRVVVVPNDRRPELTTVVAVPLSGVRSSLDQLVVIEAVAAALLLLGLGAGSWLILRQGLLPLEHMADTAHTITAGDLSQRVAPADERTEVGELGLAINTMLDSLEAAFAERDATERRLRQFLADASHELRTPLTSIQGFAELFRLDEQREHIDLDVVLRRIEEESARMKGLVEDLLLLARLDETRPFEPVAVDLAVLAADACADAVALDPVRSVTLDAPAPLVVHGDRDHLFQAISNLVGNAVRHTPAGTPIEVHAHLDRGVAVVRVRDHGPGLDPGDLDHVFDRFWQADRARAGAGAGLGLAIVAAIAAEHGGSASVANAADGGAEFALRLPLSGASS